MNYMKSPRQFYVSIKTGIVISAFILTIWTLLALITLGPVLSSRFVYIGWVLVQIIHITDFLDRVDLFVVSLWLPNLIIRFCVLYLAVLTGLASFTKSKNYKPYNALMGGIVTITALISFSNVSQVIVFHSHTMHLIMFLIQLVFFGSIFLGLLFHRHKTIKADSWKYGRVIWIALAACAGSIGLSNVLGSSVGVYGIICAALYFLCLILVLLLSLREFGKLHSH